jgi:hypothetical protein
MATFDEFGNVVADPGGFDTAPAAVGTESNFGAAVWAFFHPHQVQAEYQAVGKPVPTIEDIQGTAVADMQTHVESGVRDMIATGKWVALGVGMVAVLILVREITKGR